MPNTLEIERGYVNIYIPLKFNYSDMFKYSEMIERLENSHCVISNQSKSEKGTSIELKSYFYEVCGSIVNTHIFKKDSELKQSMHNLDLNVQSYVNVKSLYNNDNSSTINNIDSILLEFISHKLGVDFPETKIYFISDIEEFAALQVEEIVESANFSSRFFGRSIAQEKHILMLWPILIIDKNDEKQLASVIIEFYGLGLAMLRIAYPIVNQSSLPLMRSDIDLYHKSCYYASIYNGEGLLEKFDYDEVSSNEIDYVINSILRWLQSNSNGFVKIENMYMILLSQLKPQNIDISKAKKKEIEAICRIINAPIPDFVSLDSERDTVWEQQYWGRDSFRYYFSTMGRCLAIVNKDVKGLFPIDVDKELMCYSIEMSLLNNVENAYKLLLFNKLNNSNFLVLQNEMDYHELKRLEEDYILTENYILSFLDHSYGSVRDLYCKMVSICHHFLNQDAIEKRILNNERLFNNRQADKISRENDRITILGLLITILVSFPSIYESLLILKNAFIKNNIEGVSVIGVAIITEIIFLLVLLYWYRNRET